MALECTDHSDSGSCALIDSKDDRPTHPNSERNHPTSAQPALGTAEPKLAGSMLLGGIASASVVMCGVPCPNLLFDGQPFPPADHFPQLEPAHGNQTS